jgi:predicted dehydrogenase
MVEDIGVSEALIMEGAFAEVDGVLILTLDGRPHLDQLLSVLALGKPVFMDKPVAASLRDVIKVYQLAADAGVPLFSASALRWHPETLRVLHAVQGTPLGAISVGPAHALAHHSSMVFILPRCCSRSWGRDVFPLLLRRAVTAPW